MLDENIETLSNSLLEGQTGQALQLPPDITGNVSKREHYPSAHGGFADIWDCEMKHDHETTRLAQVCDGIQYLHSFSIVHGDLTGSNVLIHANGDACISDFGLSDIFSDDLDTSASSSIIAGNVRYAAPELFDTDIPPAPSSKSDIFSFGRIMLQVLTGNIPYYYVKADAQVLMELVKGVQPRRPSDVSMTNTRWNCICACWETSPSARPTSKEIGEFLKNPLLTFSHTSTEAFPDLRNVQLVEVLNSSRGVFFESWSGILTGDTQQTVAVKLIRRTSIDWRFRQSL
ncbi:hypothetical protein ONZ45_g19546 [Pleurotus djamor]|nr:hypothetical protein ONZ45_g19546 [Pleurotus djamor]